MTLYVVPFDFCNIGSIRSCLDRCSIPYKYLSNSCTLNKDDKVILPGVGTFAQGMNYLRSKNLDQILINHSLSGGFLLGICLGMQLLFESSEEDPGIPGLSLVSGSVKKLPSDQISHIPHIGWSALDTNPMFHSSDQPLFANLIRELQDKDYYFVHSYSCCTNSRENVVATVLHDGNSTNITAMICFKNIYGCQFHPEKSGPAGHSLILSLLLKTS